MEVLPDAGGRKTLSIHFRWSLYPDASIEVRLIPGALEKGTQATPIYFHELLDAKVREHLYDCLDHSERGGKTYSFTKDKIVYNMIGQQNSLGKHAVHVQIHKEETTRAKTPAAVFLQLDSWAVRQRDPDTRTAPRGLRQIRHTLHLVLPRREERLGRTDSVAGV